MRTKAIAAALLFPLGLAACADGSGQKADAGTVVGAVAGGLVGSTFGRGGGRVAATAIGAVAGGIIGHEIGRSMDRQDRILAQRAEFDALERGPAGRPVRWRNADNGRYGDVIPGEPYRRGNLDCREYEHVIYIDGRPRTMRGTACRNGDGTWGPVS